MLHFPVSKFTNQDINLLHSVAHHLILAHAYAAKVYREKYKPTQGGLIGITLNSHWQERWDDASESGYMCMQMSQS